MRYEFEVVGKDADETQQQDELRPEKPDNRERPEKPDNRVKRDKREKRDIRENREDEYEEKVSTGKSALLLLRDIGIALGVIILILQFISPTVVFEHSMEDTLYSEDYVFLARKAFAFEDVKYEDIVVFKSRLMDDRGTFKNLIKRVIGLPGDEIAIRNEAVYRNGVRLDEPYTKDGVTLGEMAPVIVPDGKVFVMGDNRQVSTDSRSEIVGFIKKDELMGRVFFRLLPISRIGKIE